jgi:hypothetical protein
MTMVSTKDRPGISITSWQKMNLPEGKVGALHNALRQMGDLTAYYVYEEDMAKRNKRWCLSSAIIILSMQNLSN